MEVSENKAIELQSRAKLNAIDKQIKSVVDKMSDVVIYEKIEDYKASLAEQLNHEELSSVRFLRKAVPEAYAYMVNADRILVPALQFYPGLFE